MDVCAGGTISKNDTSISFVNHHEEACTLSGCTMPGWPTTNPVVPAKSNGVDGTLTVPLSTPATVGSYSYSGSCCGGKRGAPVIKVQ
jgi:hypothetical protein